MSNRRQRSMIRNLALERLEARQLLTFVAVDFHNHYFAHFGDRNFEWEKKLPANRRESDLRKILANSNLNDTLPEFVTFSEHAGHKPWNHSAAVVDLESKLVTALEKRPDAASYGASVGIELSPDKKTNHTSAFHSSMQRRFHPNTTIRRTILVSISLNSSRNLRRTRA